MILSQEPVRQFFHFTMLSAPTRIAPPLAAHFAPRGWHSSASRCLAGIYLCPPRGSPSLRRPNKFFTASGHAGRAAAACLGLQAVDRGAVALGALEVLAGKQFRSGILRHKPCFANLASTSRAARACDLPARCRCRADQGRNAAPLPSNRQRPIKDRPARFLRGARMVDDFPQFGRRQRIALQRHPRAIRFPRGLP